MAAKHDQNHHTRSYTSYKLSSYSFEAINVKLGMKMAQIIPGPLRHTKYGLKRIETFFTAFKQSM